MVIGHGGNVHEIARRLGCAPTDIVDMSSNINPTGPPPGLMDHLQSELASITALPQADARDCAAAFARRHGLSESRVLAANGTTQFIYTLPRALDMQKVLIVGPTYADYADACRMQKVAYRFFLTRSEDNFVPDIQRLRRAADDFDTIVICNPNNPTGTLIPESDLAALCADFPDKRFVIDESYMPFVDTADHFSMAPAGLPHVIVLHSLSKIFRIPGLRIGFLAASAPTVDRLREQLMPWCVNSLAQTAIGYLMETSPAVEQFVRDTRAFLSGEKRFFQNSLADTSGIRLFPSTTSFVLARLVQPHTADAVLDLALSHRILLRNCANFKGLGPEYIRISLKRHPANARLVELLQPLRAGRPMG